MLAFFSFRSNEATMKYKCSNCNAICEIPDEADPGSYSCHKCQNTLSNSTKATGDTSSAVGLIGGAALGASVGGPVGAIIGGVLGAILGKESKGVG